MPRLNIFQDKNLCTINKQTLWYKCPGAPLMCQSSASFQKRFINTGLNGIQRQAPPTPPRPNLKGNKPKSTYVFASSLVAYVTLTTAVSVSVLTRKEAKTTLS